VFGTARSGLALVQVLVDPCWLVSSLCCKFETLLFTDTERNDIRLNNGLPTLGLVTPLLYSLEDDGVFFKYVIIVLRS
jgi:hypothetical protein